MALTLMRLGGDSGIKAVLSEDLLSKLGLYERLLEGEEIEMVMSIDPDGKHVRLHEATGDERPANVLRLRDDGQGEVVFLCET